MNAPPLTNGDPPGVGSFHRDRYFNGQPPPPSPDRPWVALWRNYIERLEGERLFPLPPPEPRA